MPSPARWTAALTLSAAAVCGPLALPAAAAHAAPAGPASLYAPTALVLSVGHGERAADATAERAVTLSSRAHPLGHAPGSGGGLRRTENRRRRSGVSQPGGRCPLYEGVLTRWWSPWRGYGAASGSPTSGASPIRV